MKKLYLFVLLLLFFICQSCSKDSDPVKSTITNPPTPLTGWVLAYEEKSWGTFNCSMPTPCWYDIITDSIDLRSCDSIRILLSYRSYHGCSMDVIKLPYPHQFLSCVFPDSITGRVDTNFSANYNSKVIFDFFFEISNRFTIDTLKVYRKIKD
ncbi:MAG: hypothetical protein HY959_00320 [Ignavibacteriae bacterium]|nr:hypothetical protein [Ignavibacteriota bacterium]